MQHIQNSKNVSETGEPYMDFDWNVFVEKLFARAPNDPFTFHMEFLDEIDPQQLQQLLGIMLVNGVKQRYSKEIAQLDPTEIAEVQQYYRSIGFDVEYQVKQENRYVQSLKKTVPVNLFAIDFKPYSQVHNKYNQPEKII